MGWVGCLTGLSTTGVRCCCCPKNQGWALSFQIQQCHIMLRGHHVTLHHTISRYTLCQHTQLHFNKWNTASNKPRVLQMRTWEAIRGCRAPRSSFHMLNLFPICKFAAFITWQFSSKIVYWQISSKKQHFRLNIHAKECMVSNICCRSLFPRRVIRDGGCQSPTCPSWGAAMKHMWGKPCGYEELLKTKQFLRTAAFSWTIPTQ